MATIRKLPSGTFQAIVRKKGFPARTAAFGKRSEALAWAASIEGDITAGRVNGEAHAHRLSDLIDAYKKGPLKRLRTQADRLRHIKIWTDALSDPRLGEITPKAIAQVLKDYAAKPVVRTVRVKGKGLQQQTRERSSQTVRHAHMAISAILDYAHRDLHWIDKNPARDTRRAKAARPRIRWLTDAQRVRLLEACRASGNPDLYLVVLLALTSGARQAEILNLQWSQIDWKQRCAWLTPEDTKTEEPRAMPLVREVIEELKKRPRILHVPLVFASELKRDQPRNVRQAWCVARKEAELPDFRFHDLRHSAATELLRSGNDSRIVAATLGQKTLAMVKRYTHVAPALVVDAAERAADRGRS